MSGSNGPERRVDGDLSADVNDEVSFHLEMQARELIAGGLAPDEARAEAVRLFGSVEGVRRRLVSMDTRQARRLAGGAALRDVRKDVLHGVRNLRRNPLFALVAIVTLALGIGANAAVFGLADGALFRPLPFPHDDRLVLVRDVQEGEGDYPASIPEFDDWRREGSFVQAMMAYATSRLTLTGDGPPELLTVVRLTGDPMVTLGLPPVAGRGFENAELETGERVAMLAEPFWTERFGRSPSVVGSTIRMSDQAYTVVGIMPAAAGTLRAFDPPSVWIPMRRVDAMSRGLHFLQVLGRLPDGETMVRAGSRAESVGAGLRESGATTHGIELRSLRDQLIGDTRSIVFLLLAAVGLLLVIVCVNVANLVLAHSLARTREFAVRVALGAGGRRLARQVITESLVLGGLGGVLGIGVAYGVGRVLATISPVAGMLAESPADARVLAFTFVLSSLVAVLFGLWPALRVAGSDVAGTLRSAGGARGTGRAGGLTSRRILAGAEIALCVVLLAGAGLLVRSMRNLLGEKTGFDAEDVLTFSIALPLARYDEPRQTAFFEDLLDRVRALPGVAHAGVVSELPLGGGDTNGGFSIPGREFPEGQEPFSKKRIASGGYFESLGVPLISGRYFTGDDRAGAPEVVIITEALAKRWWPGEDPVGRRMLFSWGSDGEQEIVGVVGDVVHDGLDQPMIGMAFRPMAQFQQSGFSVVVKARTDAMALVNPIRSQLQSLDPAIPMYGVRTMDQIVASSVGARRTTMLLVTVFALVALILATVGVYAIASQAVAQRTSEIGLRMAMGARRRDVVWLVLRQELPVIVVGSAIGLAGAIAGTRVLRASLYRVSPGDPVTLAAAIALLAVVALVATLIPAHRAAGVDPLSALRSRA